MFSKDLLSKELARIENASECEWKFSGRKHRSTQHTETTDKAEGKQLA